MVSFNSGRFNAGAFNRGNMARHLYRPLGYLQPLFSPIDIPKYVAGLISEADAHFSPGTGWTLDTALSIVGGQVQTAGALTGQAEAHIEVVLPAEEIWLSNDQEPAASSGGGVRSFIDTPDSLTNRTNKRNGVTVSKHIRTIQENAGFRFNLGYDGAVKHFQAVPMATNLAKPCKIILVAGEARGEARSTSLPVDTDFGDAWRDARCLAFPAASNSTFKHTQYVLEPSVIPLQSQDGNSALGVSPAHRFQTNLLSAYAEEFNIVLVQCAIGGSQLIGDDAEWNPDGSVGNGGIHYAGMIGAAQAALSNLPAGSEVVCLAWLGGESDDSATVADDYPPALQGLLSRVRTDLAVPQLPMVIFGPNPDVSTWDNLAAGQATLDMGADHVNATANVIFVPCPAGYNENGVAVTAAGSREHGSRGAFEFIRRILNMDVGNIVVDQDDNPVTDDLGNFVTV